MFYEILTDSIICLFALLVAAAAYQDVKSFTLPNVYSLSVAVIYPAFVLSSNSAVEWLPAIGIALTAIIIGFLLFALKLCGGGDAKLFAATALWAGPSMIIDFTLLVAVAGGVIAIAMWCYQRASLMVPFLPQGSSYDSDDFTKKPMPYGVAIAIGAVYVAFTLLR